MFELLKSRLQQGHQTTQFPDRPAQLPTRFRGRPVVAPDKCEAAAGCQACVDACPTQAITAPPLRLDLGACVFCGACEAACPSGAVRFTPEVALSTRSRTALVLGSKEEALAGALDAKMQALFGRSLKL